MAVKKQNKNVWLVYVVALIAIVALVLAIIAMNKVNMTGQGIFDFLKKQEVKEQTQTQQNQITADSKGLLGDTFLANGGDFEMLKGYQVKYGDEGELIYEISEGGENLKVSNNYLGDEIIPTNIQCKCGGNSGEPCGGTGPDNCEMNAQYLGNVGMNYKCEGSCPGACGCSLSFEFSSQ